jgi:hypothetical protein
MRAGVAPASEGSIMTDHAAAYANRLSTPAEAAARIPSGAKIAMALGAK